jgi:hypothetical protein
MGHHIQGRGNKNARTAALSPLAYERMRHTAIDLISALPTKLLWHQ